MENERRNTKIVAEVKSVTEKGRKTVKNFYAIVFATAMLCLAATGINAGSAENSNLKKWTDRVIPLPHEVKVTGSVTVPVNKIKCSGKIKDPQQVVISKLLKTLMTEKQSVTVDIKLGLVSDSKLNVPKEIKKRLGKLPNKDQAYAIVSSKHGDKLNIILTANTGYGLLYAVRTFSQMLKLPAKITPETRIEVPVVNIVDWPDIGERGQWGNHSQFFMPEFSKLKLNLIAQFSRPGIDKNGNPVIMDHAEQIKQAAEYGIKYVLYVSHLSILGSTTLAKVPYNKKLKHLVPALAKLKNGKPAPYPDFENPLMEKMFAKWLMEIADAVAPYHKIMSLWLSEGTPGNFTTCKGKRVSYKIELDAIKKAFGKVKKKYPDMTLQVAISQGTRRAEKNSMIIDYCEKNNFGVHYYDGHLTYISDKKPMIFPELTKMAAQGKWVGCIPQITNSWRTVVPMTSPQLVKFRCKEFADKKLSCIWGYSVPNKLFYEFNFAAMAEWSWNANGRSPEEFSRIYAISKNMPDPDLFAAWAVKEGKASWELAASNLIICLVHDPAMGFYGSVPFDYTYGGASKLHNIPELDKVIKTARDALKIAKQIGNPDLLNESVFTYYSLMTFNVLKKLSADLRKKKISPKVKQDIKANLDWLDYAAAQIRSNVVEWGKRHAARQYWMKGRLFMNDRLLESAKALTQTCDALRTVTAGLRIPDPRPETRLVDVGEWTIKDVSRNKAKLQFDVSKLVSRTGGDYNVCLDLLESRGLSCVIISWIKLLGVSPGKPPQVLAVSSETRGGAYPRVRNNASHIECSLKVPATPGTQKLILEIDLNMWALGRRFPEGFPAKQRVCWGLVSLRRVYGSKDFPKTGNVSGSKASPSRKLAEEPQKKIKIRSKGKVIQVGITNGYNAEGLLMSLKGRRDINPFTIRRITPENLEKCNVLLVSQSPKPMLLNRNAKLLVNWVEAGGGIMFFHDGVGYRKHLSIFKDIGMGITNPRAGRVKVIKKHPVTQGVEMNKYFHPGYSYDHVVMKVGPKGEILLSSADGRPVLIAGELGKGRIVLNGMLTGWKSSEKSPRGSTVPTAGDELKILLNSIKWLAN